MTLVCIIIRIFYSDEPLHLSTMLFPQFLFDILSIGPWSPAINFWSSNLPLWFMQNLLWYYYFSWYFVGYIRSIDKVSSLVAMLVGLMAFRIAVISAVLVALIYIFPDSYEDYGFIVHTWSLCQIYLPFMGATLCEIAARLGPVKLSKVKLWILTDIVTIMALSAAFFIPYFTEDRRLRYLFANLCDYGDLIVCPLLLVGLYLHSHDVSTISYIYDLIPRFWNDSTRASFPAFLFHWPIMLSLVIMCEDVLTFESAADVVFICSVCVLFSILIDSYVVLSLEDQFVDAVKPRLAAVMDKFGSHKKLPHS